MGRGRAKHSFCTTKESVFVESLDHAIRHSQVIVSTGSRSQYLFEWSTQPQFSTNRGFLKSCLIDGLLQVPKRCLVCFTRTWLRFHDTAGGIYFLFSVTFTHLFLSSLVPHTSRLLKVFHRQLHFASDFCCVVFSHAWRAGFSSEDINTIHAQSQNDSNF